MTTSPDSRIAFVDRIDDGVFIQFADGKSALFPDEFFRAHYAWFTVGPVDAAESMALIA